MDHLHYRMVSTPLATVNMSRASCQGRGILFQWRIDVRSLVRTDSDPKSVAPSASNPPQRRQDRRQKRLERKGQTNGSVSNYSHFVVKFSGLTAAKAKSAKRILYIFLNLRGLFIIGFTLFSWAAVSWWIPLLLMLGSRRFLVRRDPLGRRVPPREAHHLHLVAVEGHPPAVSIGYPGVFHPHSPAGMGPYFLQPGEVLSKLRGTLRIGSGLDRLEFSVAGSKAGKPLNGYGKIDVWPSDEPGGFHADHLARLVNHGATA